MVRAALIPAFVSALLLTGCADRPTALAPTDGEAPTPRHDLTVANDTDGDYSLFFTDFERVNEFKVEVAQDEDVSGEPLVECGDGFSTALGSGYFLVIDQGTRVGGTLEVEDACYKDWDTNKGFPESAEVKGTAYSSGDSYPFTASLDGSAGFPVIPGNPARQPLDEATLTIDGLGIDETFEGELHHEDEAF